MWYINGRVVSLPLTNMRYINGWVVSLVLRRKARDFFHISAERIERMKKTGFYIIKDRFFEDMPDPYLKGNKAGNRPQMCIRDSHCIVPFLSPPIKAYSRRSPLYMPGLWEAWTFLFFQNYK